MSDEHHETPAGSTDLFSLEALRELLRLVGQTDVSELQIERDGSRIHIKREPGRVAAAHPMAPAASGAPAWATTVASMPPPVSSPGGAPFGGMAAERTAYTLRAPMVGTFRAAPSPAEPPFVQEGDAVNADSTVCMIEALGQMNRVGADMAGRVQRVLVQDGQSVEYGQPLMLLEPA
jgi:acetyl-CoA carboxylase biotin carboxyl carrier protein